MRKTPTLLILLCGLFVSAVDADVIYLKSGRQIQCTSAWEEGKEIKYTIGTGRIGIPKSLVAKIVKGQSVEPPQTTALASMSKTDTVSDKQKEADAKINAELAAIYTSSGEALIQKKDFAGALEYFQKAYRSHTTPETTLHLAATYFFLKDDWNAELYFNELLTAEPNNTEALNYLGEIAWRGENLSDALNYWQKSVRIKPDPVIQEKLKRLEKENSASDSYENSTSRHFLIRYDGGAVDASLVHAISDFLEDIYHKLAIQFDNYPNDPFVIVLYPQQQFFRATELPFWAGGANDGKIKLPIKGITQLNEELKEVLTHEMAHSFVRLKTSNNCPVWLQEGLAQYTEGKRTGYDDQQTLVQLSSHDQLPPVQNLAGSFLSSDSRSAALLYMISLSFTQFLLEHFPGYQMNETLDEMAKSASYQGAFEHVYGEPFNQLEAEWKRALQQE